MLGSACLGYSLRELRLLTVAEITRHIREYAALHGQSEENNGNDVEAI